MPPGKPLNVSYTSRLKKKGRRILMKTSFLSISSVSRHKHKILRRILRVHKIHFTVENTFRTLLPEKPDQYRAVKPIICAELCRENTGSLTSLFRALSLRLPDLQKSIGIYEGSVR